jgi:hypothetical protein
LKNEPAQTQDNQSSADRLPQTETDGQAKINLNLFDGTRKPLAANTEVLIRIIDGNQKQLFADFRKGASLQFNVPFYGNFGDQYTVIVSADRYVQAGFQPVKLTPALPRTVDLMLLPKDGDYNFFDAKWTVLGETHPVLRNLLAHGAGNEAAARDRYEQFMEDKPDSLAAFLNITTAMAGIHLPVGTPIDYLKEIIWDDAVVQDRFYAWADRDLVEQVKRAATAGFFAPEIGRDFFTKTRLRVSSRCSSAKRMYSLRFMKAAHGRSTASIAS